jgi:dTDP-4-amino-4,6-dideoxygalactose transaminase
LETQGLLGFFQRPVVKAYGRHTFNQYVVRVPAHHRDSLVNHMKAEKVGVEVYYPLSLHLQECVKFLGHKPGDFPVSEEASRAVLALPVFPEITEAQQKRVVEVCAGYVRSTMRLVA